MKKTIICVLLVVAVMLSLTACNTRKAEGIWVSEDGESGYVLGQLGKLETGEKMGTVELLEDSNDFSSAFTTYLYRFTDGNKIEIIRYSPSLSNDGIGLNETQYDLLKIEGMGKNRVLVSEKTGDRYYYQGS